MGYGWPVFSWFVCLADNQESCLTLLHWMTNSIQFIFQLNCIPNNSIHDKSEYMGTD